MRLAIIAGHLGLAATLLACGEPERSEAPRAEATGAPHEPLTLGETTEAGPPPPAPPEADALPPSPPEASAPEPAKKDILTLAFVGDVVLGEYVFDTHRTFASTSVDPFARARGPLHADLLVGNLESPLMQQVPERSPLRFGRRFAGSAAAADVLAHAGFDVMSLANNHANDLGRPGLEQTPGLLRDRGLTPVGEARPQGSPFAVQTLVHEGWRIGLLSATTWLNHAPTPGDPAVPLARAGLLPDHLVPLLTAARDEHDLLVVLLHWGREKRDEPGFIQVRVAHALVDAGADLVVGHHPHVLQGVERYGDGLIAYSLGNFLFPARVHEYRDTAVFRVRWRAQPRCWAAATITPLRLDRTLGHAPRPATLRERRTILERVRRLGHGLRTHWADTGDTLTLSGC